MTGTTITMGPTVCNPDALDTVDELRLALHRANEQALDMGEQLHRVTCIKDRLTNDLSLLLVAHLQKEPVRVFELLTQMTRRYVRSVPTVNKDGAGRVH